MKHLLLFLTLAITSSLFGYQVEALIPWATNNANFGSKIVISNLNNQEVEVILVATRNNGEEEIVSRKIAALSQLVESTSSLFPTLGEGAGYRVFLTSLDGDINAGFVVTGKASASGDSPAQADALAPAQASKLLVFTYLPITDDGFSAPVIVNMGDETALVRLHAYRDGALVATSAPISLESGRPFADVTGNLFPELGQDVFVIAESDQPLLGAAFIFNALREPSMSTAAAIERLPNDTTAKKVTETRAYEGHVVTGINRFMGSPILNLGHGLETAGFPTIGAFNPDGNETLPLTREMLDGDTDAVVLAAGFGLAPSGNDNFNANTPLHRIPVITGVLGLSFARNVLQAILLTDQLSRSIAEPSSPVTLAQWLKATGNAQIRCYDDGTAEVTIQVKNLLPNRLYSVWSSYAGDSGLITEATGGVPNALTTDALGNGTFKRILNFCPYDLKEGERALLLMDVVLHSDHTLYGALPTASLPGKDAHAHLGFFLEGTFINKK